MLEGPQLEVRAQRAPRLNLYNKFCIFFTSQFIFYLLPPLLSISNPFLIDLCDRDSFPRSG